MAWRGGLDNPPQCSCTIDYPQDPQGRPCTAPIGMLVLQNSGLHFCRQACKLFRKNCSLVQSRPHRVTKNVDAAPHPLDQAIQHPCSTSCVTFWLQFLYGALDSHRFFLLVCCVGSMFYDGRRGLCSLWCHFRVSGAH